MNILYFKVIIIVEYDKKSNLTVCKILWFTQALKFSRFMDIL